MEAILVLSFSYFMGSIPTAYIAGKWLKGIDVTRVGSESVGGTNIWQTVSRKAAVLVSLADVSKGASAVFLAMSLSLALHFQIACGLIAMAGHNWSPFLRFKGGRGVACAAGVLLLLAPWGFIAISPLIILGFVLRNLPLATIVISAALPLFIWALEQNSILAFGLSGIPLIMLTKRVVANGEPFTPGNPFHSVLINRILLDRDILDREAWVRRSMLNRTTSRKN